MRLISIFILTSLFPILGYTQYYARLITELHPNIEESSGLLLLNDRLITHNDSGGQAALYEIDSLTGTISRTVTIDNANNIDWEDLSKDENYIYIGDFGNNAGSRTDLKIYKISIDDYLNSESISAELINLSYEDQTDFTPSEFSTNFDAEAFIAYKDSLYIFTKNWGDSRSNVYSLSKDAGTQSAKKVDVLDTQGLVTSACYDPETDGVILVGYVFTNPFVVGMYNIDGNKFSEAEPLIGDGISTSGTHSTQIESVTPLGDYKYLMTAEDNFTGNPALYELHLFHVVATTTTVDQTLKMYPNPVADILHIEADDFSRVEVYDLSGQLLRSSTAQKVDMHALGAGVYFVRVILKNKLVRTGKVFKN